MKTRLISALLLASQVFGSVAISRELPPIKIATLMDFKPFVWCEKGTPKGIDVDIITELFSRIKRSISVECLPWKRALSNIKAGDVDALFSGYKTEEREAFAIFLDSPIHTSSFNAFVRKGEEFSYSGIESLYEKRIGITLGYSVNPEFDAAKSSKRISVFESRSTETGIRMLLAGRIDVYINGKIAVLYTAKKIPGGGGISPLLEPMHVPRPAYLLFSKAANLQYKKQLIQSLNHALGQMWSDGTIMAIVDSYARFPVSPSVE